MDFVSIYNIIDSEADKKMFHLKSLETFIWDNFVNYLILWLIYFKILISLLHVPGSTSEYILKLFVLFCYNTSEQSFILILSDDSTARVAGYAIGIALG